MAKRTRKSGHAQKKEELLGEDTVKLDEAEYKLQSLVSPEFHESDPYFHKPAKQIGDLRLDTLSPAQINFLQTSNQWPHYSEPKPREGHQGTIYPENPVQFPTFKNNAQQDDNTKQWWNPGMSDPYSKADLGSPQERSYERNLEGDNKSWWGSDRDYSDFPNGPSANFQPYPAEKEGLDGQRESSLTMEGKPKFVVDQASNLMATGQERQENMVGAAGQQDALLRGPQEVQRNQGHSFVSPGLSHLSFANSEGTEPSLFGNQVGALFGHSNSLGTLKSSQERQETEGILQGLQEAASMVNAGDNGRDLSSQLITKPVYDKEDIKANARSLPDKANKKQLFYARNRKPLAAKNAKGFALKGQDLKIVAFTGTKDSKGYQTSRSRNLLKHFSKQPNEHTKDKLGNRNVMGKYFKTNKR